MINVGTGEIQAIKVGTDDAIKAYQGETLVWSKEQRVYTALTCEYRIVSAGTYQICSSNAATAQTSIIVDGEVRPSTSALTFTAGTHEVEFTGMTTTLEYRYFAEIDTLVTVHFPSTMTFLGPSVFVGCTNLEHADMSDTNIGSANAFSFSGCTSLKEIRISPVLQQVYMELFGDCTSVTSITLNNVITSINNGAFKNVGSDNSHSLQVVIPSSVTRIDEYAFKEANINDLILSEGLETIGDSAFYDTNLTDIILPSTVTSVGIGAFYRASSGYISLNEGLETVGDEAFYGCGASDLIIPSTVTSIGDRAFEDVGYETVKFMGATPPAMGDTIFGYIADYRPQVIYVPAASLQAYTTALTASYSGYTSHIVAY